MPFDEKKRKKVIYYFCLFCSTSSTSTLMEESHEEEDDDYGDHLSLLSVESVGKMMDEHSFVDKRQLLASMSTLSSVSSVTLLGGGGACPDADSMSCASMPGVAFPQGLPEPDRFMDEMRQDMSTPVKTDEGDEFFEGMRQDLQDETARASTPKASQISTEPSLPVIEQDESEIATTPVHNVPDPLLLKS